MKDKLDVNGNRINNSTPFWSGSQIYGMTEEETNDIRRNNDGTIKENGYINLPFENYNIDNPKTNIGFKQNQWHALHMLHVTFAKEHNYICNRLLRKYPNYRSQQIFEIARLVNTACIAKIHVLEWTTALNNNEILRFGQKGLWYGITGTQVHPVIRKWFKSPYVIGIPGSKQLRKNGKLQGFQHAEEFMSTYRMHALIPIVFDIEDKTYSLTDSIEQIHKIEKLIILNQLL